MANFFFTLVPLVWRGLGVRGRNPPPVVYGHSNTSLGTGPTELPAGPGWFLVRQQWILLSGTGFLGGGGGLIPNETRCPCRTPAAGLIQSF